MRIGVIIPDRGDRPEFLRNSLRMLGAQTISPAIVEVISPADVVPSGMCDITKRYRAGYNKLKNRELDVVAFWENDDFYAPDYLETMIAAWKYAGRPDIFGTNYTIYYHLRIGAYFTMTHNTRASAMNTLIKPGLAINWPVDHEPFTDMHLWTYIGKMDSAAPCGKVFSPGRHISIGMKHGIGMCGGYNHLQRLSRYRFPDHDQSFLKKHLDPDSFNFYSKFYEPDFVNTSK